MSGPNGESVGIGIWRERLSEWLSEWDVYNKLREADQEDEKLGEKDESEPLDAMKMVKPCNEPVRKGDLRILSRRIVGDTDMPVYVAVISEWEDGHWLVAPYNQLSTPATTGELRTDRDDYGLRVLCLWNAHSISEDDLFFSFLEDRLEDQEIEDAWSVFRSVSTGHDLPVQLRDRVGPPISHPKDPRIAYQEECSDLMSPIRKLWELPWIPTLVGGTTSEAPAEFESEANVMQEMVDYELAAASQFPSRSKSKYYSIEGTEYYLVVTRNSEEGKLFFSLEDEEGPTEKLEGYRILLSSGEKREHILEGGHLSLPLAGEPSFRLLDPDGKFIHLIEG